MTELIRTTKGDIDASLLEKRVDSFENENEITKCTEYRFLGEDEIVRRDVHVELKKNVFSEPVLAE